MSNIPSAEKLKALESVLSQLDKQFGKGAVTVLGKKNSMEIETIPSGALSLDLALGGGWPRGRIIEVYGPESGGKTTTALHAIAEAQKIGGIAAFIDAEHSLDPVYAKSLGVDTDMLVISQPNSGEEALEIAEGLIRSNAIDLIVIDSVAALVPRAELEGQMGDSHVGLHARLMSQGLRKLVGAINNSKCVCIFINQIREKVGVMFGNPETTTGGRALKFYSSVRLEVRKGEAIKQGEEVIGSRTKFKVVKNKIAPPFRTTEIDVMYGEGYNAYGDLLDLAVKHNIVGKSGAWFSYGDGKIGQGRENAKKYLKDNPEIYNEIRSQVMTTIGLTKEIVTE